MIEVHSLSRRYGKTIAVEEVSFQIDNNEIVGLLGHNGAGKTTIMRMLSGYLEPSGGSVSIGGLELASNTHRVQQQLGYLPENLPVYPDMMVADYLDYAATLKGLQGPALISAVRSAIGATELQARLLDPIATLSRGYKQRVGVAQALLGAPRVLILDEPTNGLDPYQTQHMRELIQQLAETATIILSTHIMQEVDAVCDRALILRNGQLGLDEKLSELRRSNCLLLRTSLSQQQLQQALPQFEVSSDQQGLRVTLQEDADPDQAAAAVANAIAGAAGELYRLSRETRDLETVFREVNQHEESRYVA